MQIAHGQMTHGARVLAIVLNGVTISVVGATTLISRQQTAGNIRAALLYATIKQDVVGIQTSGASLTVKQTTL
jgi:hypothetical protein